MQKFMFLLVLVLPAVLLTVNSGPRPLAFAQEEDADEGLVDVEGDDTSVTDEGTEESDLTGPKSSPDADTTILFTKPVATAGSTLDLPAGRLVEFLVGFTNRGSQDMVVEGLEASFRYPVDFSFHIQNFSQLLYTRLVKPSHQATLLYSFIPAEAFAGRPFGLNVNLHYRDAAGNPFHEAVFNETVNVVELEEGLDGETFFLYVFLAACVVLLLVAGQHFLSSVGRGARGGRSSRKAPVVETGTSKDDDIDYDWVPRETLNSLNKSPRVHKSPRSSKQSPRSRGKKSAASDN